MYAYQVGQPYNPRVRQWPEGANYNFRGGQHELLLLFPHPSAAEIRGAKTGQCEFAMLKSADSLLFFLYRFAGVPWSDAPYSWWRVPVDQRIIPVATESPELRALLQIILIDAETGIIRAIRGVTLSPDFTLALHDAIRVQASTPAGDYDQQIAAAYRRWPDTEAMLREAVSQTKGGS